MLLEAHARGGKVLLPAYIGWSAREGSGIFDPITELGLDYRFYRMREDLTIDTEHFAKQLESFEPSAVLLVHYFGWVDPAMAQLASLAKAQGAYVIEDSAHALFTERVGRACGNFGDASVYSFHKMLPVRSGGALTAELPGVPVSSSGWWNYDFDAITRIRQTNSSYLATRVQAMGSGIRPLWNLSNPSIVPQTFPVLIERGSRDSLYQHMNDAGFGVVSLYHTMISALDPSEFPASFDVARKILNLPVHQDLSIEQLEALANELERLVS